MPTMWPLRLSSGAPLAARNFNAGVIEPVVEIFLRSFEDHCAMRPLGRVVTHGSQPQLVAWLEEIPRVGENSRLKSSPRVQGDRGNIACDGRFSQWRGDKQRQNVELGTRGGLPEKCLAETEPGDRGAQIGSAHLAMVTSTWTDHMQRGEKKERSTGHGTLNEEARTGAELHVGCLKPRVKDESVGNLGVFGWRWRLRCRVAVLTAEGV